MSRGTRAVARGTFLTLLLVGWAFIAAASLDYFAVDVVADFVLEKLPVRFEALWLRSLEVHVASALVSFPLCVALATRFLRRRPRVHRWLGRVTGVLVVALLVPSGVILAFEAKGGTAGTLGFLFSGGIVFVAMVSGVLAARRRDYRAHERAMRHVVLQMSVAVTSRALLLVFDGAGVEPELAYVVALWVPVVGSGIFAEVLSSSPSRARLFPSPLHPRSSP